MALERHRFKVHGGNICKQCDFKATTYLEMNQHSISAHIKNSVKCGDCKKYFASANQRRSHAKVVHSPDIVPCPRCKVKFGNVLKLEIHLPVCSVLHVLPPMTLFSCLKITAARAAIFICPCAAIWDEITKLVLTVTRPVTTLKLVGFIAWVGIRCRSVFSR